jgi:hypothetical protein
MNSEFEIFPEHLTSYEVNYELLIRRIKTDRLLEERRRLLEHEYRKELIRPVNYSTRSLTFVVERREIETTLNSIKELMSETVNQTLHLPLSSRLNHVRERILRIPLRASRDELYATCLLLEAILREPAPSPPA